MVEEANVEPNGELPAEMQASLSRIFAQCLEAIFVVSQNTSRFIYVSDGAVRDTGYSRAELLTMGPLDLQPNATLSDVYKRAAPLINGQQEVVTFETTYRRKDGTDYPVEHSLQFLRYEDPPSFLIIVRDLSQRPSLEQIREGSISFRRIVEEAEAGISFSDAAGITTFANAKLAEMVGYSADEIVGMHSWDFLVAEDRALVEPRAARRRDGLREEYEIRLKRKNGTTFWALVDACPLYDEGGSYAGSLCVVTDITVRRDAQQALLEHQRELETRLRTVEARVAGDLAVLESAEALLPSERLVERAAKRFAVLADPHRLRILNECLIAREISVNGLSQRLGLGQSNVSKHLRLLSAAGMLTRRQEGTNAFYSLADPTVVALCEIVRERLEYQAQSELDALVGQ